MPRYSQVRRRVKPGRKPYYTIQLGGKEKSLGTDKRRAEAKAGRLKAEFYGDRPIGQLTIVAELAQAWMRRKPGREYVVRCWIKYAGQTALDDLGRGAVEDYAAHLAAREYSPWSIKDRVGYAMQILRWAHDEGWIGRVPRRPRLPTPVRRPRDVDPAIVARVLDHVPASARGVFLFIVETGCRPSEACRLDWGEVDLGQGVAIQIRSKSGHRSGSVRTLYLSTETTTRLGKVPERAGPVFLSRLGKPYTSAGLRTILRRAAKRVGTTLTPYQLRHTFAQHAADSGMGVDDIAGLLGHKDSRTARFYLEVRSERLRRAARSLDSPLRGVRGLDDDATEGSASSPSASRPTRRKPATARGARAG